RSLLSRDLPPFPTRRSSDLRSGDMNLGASWANPGQILTKFSPTEINSENGIRFPETKQCPPEPRIPTGTVAMFFDPPRSNSARRDRKSTRLNSSHDQISYAV